MSEEKQRSRRVVSMREYVAFLLKKGTLSSFAFFLFAASLLFCVIIILLVISAFMQISISITNPSYYNEEFYEVTTSNLWISNIATLALLGIAFVICRCLFRYTSQVRCRTEALERVVPLTRHNTGDLPEPGTLVRASTKPPANQADVLLRAVQGSQEMPQEQLLRPVEK